MSKIRVQGAEINIISLGDSDFIYLTNMVSNQEEGSKLIEKWLTNKNTIEFLGGISNKKMSHLKKCWDNKDCKELVE